MRYPFPILMVLLFSFSCEKVVYPDLGTSRKTLVIDAFIDNQPDTQYIYLSYTQGFYDNSAVQMERAELVSVSDISDESQEPYKFDELEAGVYGWIPGDGIDSIGIVGHQYLLTVEANGYTYTAITTLRPTTPIDSLLFNYYPDEGVVEEYYEGEFFANDLVGTGNVYWAKTFLNGIFFNDPTYIVMIIDGSFSESDQDGILFIPPVRTSITPFEDGADDEFGWGFKIGDSIALELHGITSATRYFLKDIAAQTDRSGGIAELFSVPLTNLSTNIESPSVEHKAIGFFSFSSVSTISKVLTDEAAKESRERYFRN